MVPMAESYPLQFLLLTFSGWVNRQQQQVVEYLVEENRVLKEQMEGRALRLTDGQRRRLAAKGKRIGRRLLAQVATIVTPDTILRCGSTQFMARVSEGALGRDRSDRLLHDGGVEANGPQDLLRALLHRPEDQQSAPGRADDEPNGQVHGTRGRGRVELPGALPLPDPRSRHQVLPAVQDRDGGCGRHTDQDAVSGPERELCRTLRAHVQCSR